ncbi:hypothetical protein [Jannaschia rubra]|uniref:hypothetical protein n=1 Tax=Jannaschia rubra TaxID=282197 RepID=UPI00249019C4|nr:hypothetical protein [Jannaschia rubra]
MTHDTTPGQLEHIHNRFDQIDARLDRLGNDMATARDLWIALAASTIFWTATGVVVLWLAL